MGITIYGTQAHSHIKRQNGEAFAKVLRANVLLDIPNLQHILEFAGRNIEDAMNLVMVLREIRYKVNKPVEPVREEEKMIDIGGWMMDIFGPYGAWGILLVLFLIFCLIVGTVFLYRDELGITKLLLNKL